MVTDNTVITIRSITFIIEYIFIVIKVIINIIIDKLFLAIINFIEAKHKFIIKVIPSIVIKILILLLDGLLNHSKIIIKFPMQ